METNIATESPKKQDKEQSVNSDSDFFYEELSLEEQRIQLEKELLEIEREKLDEMQRSRELDESGEVEISAKHLVMVAVVCLLFSGIVSFLCGFDVGKKYSPPPKYVKFDKSFIEAITPSDLTKANENQIQWMLKDATYENTLLIHIR